MTGCGFSVDQNPDNTVERDSTGLGPSILPVTIAEWMFPQEVSSATGDPAGVAHISITPMEPGPNSIDIEFTDLAGSRLTSERDGADVELTIRELKPEADPMEATLDAVDGRTASWHIDDLDLQSQGWYAITVTLANPGASTLYATAYALLPDPSVYGRDEIELSETDASAEDLFRRSIARQQEWKSGRWRESLGSGSDVLVVSSFALTNRADEPAALKVDSVYAGSFRDNANGSTPTPPRTDFANRVTIGQQSWSTRDGEAWTVADALPVTTFPARTEIFDLATNFQRGGAATTGDTNVEIVTFYLPPDNGQSEAWFSWWIDPQTGDVLRVAMVARLHFMIWDFYDIDGAFTIVPPAEAPAATPGGNAERTNAPLT